jgi:Ca-activated chloride channel family protein
MRRNAAPGMLNRLLILTDGFTRDPARVQNMTAEARAAGIAISTLGIGSEFNEKLLVDLADASLGNAYFARVPQEIPPAFGQELTAVQSVIMRDVQIEVSFSAGVEMRRAYRVRPSIAMLRNPARDGRKISTGMGDLDPQNPPALLVELIVPTRSVGNFRIARVSVGHPDQERGKVVDATADVVLSYKTSSSRVEQNPVVMNTVEKVTAYALQTRALEDAAAGNVAGATKKLRAAATRLLTMGEVDLAHAAEEEAARLERGGQVSPEGAKELSYATRKLTQRLS